MYGHSPPLEHSTYNHHTSEGDRRLPTCVGRETDEYCTRMYYGITFILHFDSYSTVVYSLKYHLSNVVKCIVRLLLIVIFEFLLFHICVFHRLIAKHTSLVKALALL